RQLDGGVRAGEAARELGERRRDPGDLLARLGGVGPVVEPDAEHLAGPGRRRAERGLVDRVRRGTVERGLGRPGAERVPVVVEGRRVGPEAPAGRLGDVDGAVVAGDEDGAACVVGQPHAAVLAAAGCAAVRRDVKREARRPPSPISSDRPCSVVAPGGTSSRQPFSGWSGWIPPRGPTNRSAASHLQGPVTSVTHVWTTSLLW